MFEFLKKKKKEKNPEGITILKKTEPPMCGGTDTYVVNGAPKEIKSDKMLLFDIESALGFSSEGKEYDFSFISAFAAPYESGSFIFLETADGYHHQNDNKTTLAVVEEDIFPKLVEFVKEFDLAKDNGYHSKTHGLPENFGGHIDIKYDGGETIGISNNQCPLITYAAAEKMAKIFGEAAKGKKVSFPELSSLKKIRFYEKRKNGGYTDAELTIKSDGSGVNRKASRYDDPQVYTSEKAVNAETVAAIKKTVEDSALLAWAELPDKGFDLGAEKFLTFVFDGGKEITVKSGREVADRIRDAFFNIELEMATKH